MPVQKNTDILVLGGGAAGVAAAVAAAKKGLHVTVIERNAYLGGKATAAAVGTVCGLYRYSKKTNAEYIVKGFTRSFAESLMQASQTSPLSNAEGLHYLPYNIEAFKKLCLQLLEEYKVEIVFNATLNKVNIENGQALSAQVTVGDSLIDLELKSLIDCSGDAVVSRNANLPLLANDHYQAAAQVFSLEGVAEDNEARLGLILMKALRLAIEEQKLPDYCDRVYVVQGSLKNQSVSLKLGIPVMVTYEKGNLENIRIAGLDFIEKLVAFLVAELPVFKNARISYVAPEPGIRVGPRTPGRYTLTEDDVLCCRKFEDAVANGSWPIEEWEQQRKVKMKYFSLDDHYQVPAGCLQSLAIKNLFMAGRNISATDTAIASARVMGTCLQTGYAAGYLAAARVLGEPELTAINSIQNGQL